MAPQVIICFHWLTITSLFFEWSLFYVKFCHIKIRNDQIKQIYLINHGQSITIIQYSSAMLLEWKLYIISFVGAVVSTF